MLIQLENHVITTLAAPISGVVTSLDVAVGDGVLFPTLTAGEYFYITLMSTDLQRVEICKCTSVAGDTLTIERGVDDSTAQPFALGDEVTIRHNKAVLFDISDSLRKREGRNNTGGILSAFKVVKATGHFAVTDVPYIQAVDDSTVDQPMGVLSTACADGTSSEVVAYGVLTCAGFNTTAAAIEDPVYCDATGDLTLTSTPIEVGRVLSTATNGVVLFDIGGAGGAGGGGASMPPNVVLVDPDGAAVAGEVYLTIGAALAYIATQTPSDTNRWGFEFSGTNTEDITMPIYVSAIGVGDSARLTGNITSSFNFTTIPTRAAFSAVHIFNARITNITLGTALHCITLVDCVVEGAALTASSLLVLIGGSIQGGTFTGAMGTYCIRTMIFGGTFDSSLALLFGFLGGTGTFTVAGGDYKHSILEEGGSTTYNGGAYDVRNCVLDANITLDTASSSNFSNVSSQGVSTITLNHAGASLYTSAVDSNINIVETLGGWTSYGEKFRNANTDLAAENVQGAIEELAGGMLRQQYKVFNVSGSAIPACTLVRSDNTFVTPTPNVPTIAPVTSYTDVPIGISQETIHNNNVYGTIITYGLIVGMDTSTGALEDPVYATSTGVLTLTQTPFKIGQIAVQAGVGTVLVNIDKTYQLPESGAGVTKVTVTSQADFNALFEIFDSSPEATTYGCYKAPSAVEEIHFESGTYDVSAFLTAKGNGSANYCEFLTNNVQKITCERDVILDWNGKGVWNFMGGIHLEQPGMSIENLVLTGVNSGNTGEDICGFYLIGDHIQVRDCEVRTFSYSTSIAFNGRYYIDPDSSGYGGPVPGDWSPYTQVPVRYAQHSHLRGCISTDCVIGFRGLENIHDFTISRALTHGTRSFFHTCKGVYKGVCILDTTQNTGLLYALFLESSDINDVTITDTDGTAAKNIATCFYNTDNVNNIKFDFHAANTVVYTANIIRNGTNFDNVVINGSKVTHTSTSPLFYESTQLHRVSITLGETQFSLFYGIFYRCDYVTNFYVDILSVVDGAAYRYFAECEHMDNGKVLSFGGHGGYGFLDCKYISNIRVEVSGNTAHSVFQTVEFGTNLDVQVDGIKGIGVNGYVNCIRLSNCDIYGTSTNNFNYGFDGCSHISNCTCDYALQPFRRSHYITSSYATIYDGTTGAFNNCTNVTACAARGTTTYGLFYNCTPISTCTADLTGGSNASNGFRGCTHMSGCQATDISDVGCGFYSCDYISSCSAIGAGDGTSPESYVFCNNISSSVGIGATSTTVNFVDSESCTGI